MKMKRIVLAIIIVLSSMSTMPVDAQSDPVRQAQQDAAAAQAAADAAAAQAAAAQQAAQAAAARAQAAQAQAQTARTQAEVAQTKALALESQQAALAAQAAQAQADAAARSAAGAADEASRAAEEARLAAAEAARLRILAQAANTRALMAVANQAGQAAQYRREAAQQAAAWSTQQAAMFDALKHERVQADLFRLVAGLLCAALMVTMVIALMVWRRLRELSVVVVETAAPVQGETIEARLPDRVRVINDPAVIERLDDLFEGGA